MSYLYEGCLQNGSPMYAESLSDGYPNPQEACQNAQQECPDDMGPLTNCSNLNRPVGALFGGNKKKEHTLYIVLGVVGGVLLLTVILYFIFRKNRRK